MENTLFYKKVKEGRSCAKLWLSIFRKSMKISLSNQKMIVYLYTLPFNQKIAKLPLKISMNHLPINKSPLKQIFCTIPVVNLLSFTNSSWPWRQAVTTISNTSIRMWTNNSNWSRSRCKRSGIFTIRSTSWSQKWTNFFVLSRRFHCTENTFSIII